MPNNYDMDKLQRYRLQEEKQRREDEIWSLGGFLLGWAVMGIILITAFFAAMTAKG